MNIESGFQTSLFYILQLLVPFQIFVLYLLLLDGALWRQPGCYSTALEGMNVSAVNVDIAVILQWWEPQSPSKSPCSRWQELLNLQGFSPARR